MVQNKAGFYEPSTESVQIVIPSSASFVRVWCKRDVVVQEVKLKDDNEFKCQTYANQWTDIAENCSGI